MMNSVFKNMMLILMLLFCLPPAFALDSKDFTAPTPTEDFIDNGDGTVTHKKTKLTWMRCSMGQTWDNATSNCTGEASQYKWDEAMALKSDFAGKKDWRLANIDELLSIVEKGAEKPAINSTIFPNTPFPNTTFEGNSWVWSSSPFAYSSDDALVVNFGSGYADIGNKGYGIVVRLVRGGQWFSGFLAETNKEAKKEKIAKAKEAKCMRTPKCRAKKEQEEAARRAKEERAQEAAERYKRQREQTAQTNDAAVQMCQAAIMTSGMNHNGATGYCNGTNRSVAYWACILQQVSSGESSLNGAFGYCSSY